MWKMEMEEGNTSSITFHLKSPDGDQGMPGNADVAVRYTLTDDNKINIQYHAVADKNTVFNLTNHTYFNLNGHDSGPIGDHIFWLDCDYFTPIDAEFIPTGDITPVKGTPMDFTTPKAIGSDADARDYRQIEMGNGYDHNYVINAPSLEKPCGHVWSDKTGIELKVYTTLPGIQVYSGNNMGKDSGEKAGVKYRYREGFCLETQYFPDAPNKPNFPSAAYPAGKAFESTTMYQFGLYGGK
jgi:aldose 1-epimerase